MTGCCLTKPEKEQKEIINPEFKKYLVDYLEQETRFEPDALEYWINAAEDAFRGGAR